MSDTQEAIQQGWLVNTEQLQMLSVIEFMGCLGYNYQPLRGSSFITKYDEDGFHACERIKFTTAVKLHNTMCVHSSRYIGYLFPYPGGVHTATMEQPLRLDSSSPFHLDAYTFNKAQASRIVEQVYLNGGRKGISCYRQQIKFVNPDYYDLFLVPLIKEAEKIRKDIVDNFDCLIYGDEV